MVYRNTPLYIIENVVEPRLGRNIQVPRSDITLMYSQNDLGYTLVHPHPSRACW